MKKKNIFIYNYTKRNVSDFEKSLKEIFLPVISKNTNFDTTLSCKHANIFNKYFLSQVRSHLNGPPCTSSVRGSPRGSHASFRLIGILLVEQIEVEARGRNSVWNDRVQPWATRLHVYRGRGGRYCLTNQSARTGITRGSQARTSRDPN